MLQVFNLLFTCIHAGRQRGPLPEGLPVGLWPLPRQVLLQAWVSPQATAALLLLAPDVACMGRLKLRHCGVQVWLQLGEAHLQLLPGRRTLLLLCAPQLHCKSHACSCGRVKVAMKFLHLRHCTRKQHVCTEHLAVSACSVKCDAVCSAVRLLQARVQLQQVPEVPLRLPRGRPDPQQVPA
jgi:hypothetical protein